MTEVLMPALVTAGASAVIGALLAIVAKVMAVEIDPIQESIMAALPGVNCGVCGYAGCEDYARAITSGGEENIKLCRPGKQVAIDKIAEILKTKE